MNNNIKPNDVRVGDKFLMSAGSTSGWVVLAVAGDLCTLQNLPGFGVAGLKHDAITLKFMLEEYTYVAGPRDPEPTVKVGDFFHESPGSQKGWRVTAVRSDDDFDVMTEGWSYASINGSIQRHLSLKTNGGLNGGIGTRTKTSAVVTEAPPVAVAAIPAPVKKAKVNKIKGKLNRRPLYLIASKNGMTHKGLASKVNERGVNTFGNSVTQALSKYEDRFGQQIDLDNAVCFKLVPVTIRKDSRSGKARLGREIK
jgi:hypothetical protein